MKKAVIRWSIYWLIVAAAYLGLSFYFKSFVYYSMLPVLAAVYFAVRILLYAPFRNLQNQRLRRVLHMAVTVVSLGVTVLLCCFVITGVSNTANTRYIEALDYSGFSSSCTVYYDDETGVYTLRASGDEIRILQLTDIHLCAGVTTLELDRRALTACYEVIKAARPDLILVTGDIVYPIPIQSFTNDNLRPFFQFCLLMDRIGIPWAMVYGNHDTEAIAAYDAKTLTGLMRYYQSGASNERENPGALLYSDVQPDIYGRYNNYLRIENADGTLNRLIFLLDSNDYVSGSAAINDYDSVHRDQMDWYASVLAEESEEEGRTVPSFVFMHIPFKEFADADAALKSGSPDAVFLFGVNGEGVSHPDRDSGFFDRILQMGSTQAVFVGHDHLNNMGIRYKGVDLVYSKSIDYMAYPGISQMTAQRGGTLITVTKDGYEITQIDYAH